MPDNLKPVQLTAENWKQDKEKFTYSSGPYELELFFEPLQVIGYVDENPVISVNDRSLMNFERYRTEGEHMRH